MEARSVGWERRSCSAGVEEEQLEREVTVKIFRAGEVELEQSWNEIRA
jgi:hypothetical protein